ncbi:hypothetical protein BDV97DRAFT_187934 [Delphinella strobiligena]|nr:hypothetical protein BDV97DRAFT_187934 [Delphinella strobiligena]
MAIGSLPINAESISSIASLLDSSNVPYVLWDKWLLTLYGVPTIVDGIAFIVADDTLQQAYKILLAATFSLASCDLGESCLCSPQSTRRYVPAPSAHLHAPGDSIVMLFKQSELLSEVPDLTAISTQDNPKPDIVLASDTQRLPDADLLGRGGRFPSDLYPVRALSCRRFVQTCILVLQRDHKESHSSYFMSHLCYIADYVNDNDIFDINDLRPSHRAVFEAVKYGTGNLWDHIRPPEPRW